MEVKIATDSDEQLWDSMVERSPNGTLYHTWKWLKLVEKYSTLRKAGMDAKARLEPVFLMDKGKPVGIYPLFFFHVLGLTYCYSPPSQGDTLFLGPLFPDTDGTRPEAMQGMYLAMQKEMDRFIREDRKSNYVQICTPPGFDDCRPFKWAGYRTESHYTYTIDLSQGTEGIWNGFNRNLKRAIEKARKDGITVTEGDRDDAIHFYGLLRNRNRAKYTDEYIGAACDTFSPGNMKIFVAKKEAERMSGAINIMYKDTMSLWVGLPKTPGMFVNELVTWESILWASAHGYRTFEIVGADDYSLLQFKKKFNGNLVQFFQVKWYSPALYVFVSLFNSLFKGQRNQIKAK